MSKFFTFTVEITGYGETEDAAWEDATADNSPISRDDVVSVCEGDTGIEEAEDDADPTDDELDEMFNRYWAPRSPR